MQEEHERRLGQVQLPADEGALQRSHEAAVLHALARFDAEKFGNLGQGGAGPLRGSLTNVLIKQLEYAPIGLFPFMPTSMLSFSNRLGTMTFGSSAKVLAKCKLKYYRISECWVLDELDHHKMSCTTAKW